MHDQTFWNVDLVKLFKSLIADMVKFALVTCTFVVHALQIIIPTLIFCFLFSIDFKIAS